MTFTYEKIDPIRAARAMSIQPLINDLLPSHLRSDGPRGLAHNFSYRILDAIDLFQTASTIALFRDVHPQKFREFLANL